MNALPQCSVRDDIGSRLVVARAAGNNSGSTCQDWPLNDGQWFRRTTLQFLTHGSACLSPDPVAHKQFDGVIIQLSAVSELQREIPSDMINVIVHVVGWHNDDATGVITGASRIDDGATHLFGDHVLLVFRNLQVDQGTIVIDAGVGLVGSNSGVPICCCVGMTDGLASLMAIRSEGRWNEVGNMGVPLDDGGEKKFNWASGLST